MITINETLAGEPITFYCLESGEDGFEYREFVRAHRWLALDTESTGLNCYRPGWQLRTFQCGNARVSYVVPAKMRWLIRWTMKQHVNWIGHNGPHDIRCIDRFLGFETNVICKGETFIPAHHFDSRNQQEGGIGHALKDLAVHLLDKSASRWESELKEVFKGIQIPIRGEVYKSGPRKGQQKVRRAKLSEGWGLIDPMHLAYIAYAAADPILTYRLWQRMQTTVADALELYRFDHALGVACDRLQRRGMPLDVPYTERLNMAYTSKVNKAMAVARSYGCDNLQSGQQLAATLIALGVLLRERTPTGQFKMDDRILRGLLTSWDDPAVRRFISAVLVAKQCLKRRESYTEAFLRELSSDGRVHASINILAARTARMSVSSPALQQLPTKDREEELDAD